MTNTFNRIEKDENVFEPFELLPIQLRSLKPKEVSIHLFDEILRFDPFEIKMAER